MKEKIKKRKSEMNEENKQRNTTILLILIRFLLLLLFVLFFSFCRDILFWFYSFVFSSVFIILSSSSFLFFSFSLNRFYIFYYSLCIFFLCSLLVSHTHDLLFSVVSFVFSIFLFLVRVSISIRNNVMHTQRALDDAEQVYFSCATQKTPVMS